MRQTFEYLVEMKRGETRNDVRHGNEFGEARRKDQPGSLGLGPQAHHHRAGAIGSDIGKRLGPTAHEGDLEQIEHRAILFAELPCHVANGVQLEGGDPLQDRCGFAHPNEVYIESSRD